MRAAMHVNVRESESKLVIKTPDLVYRNVGKLNKAMKIPSNIHHKPVNNALQSPRRVWSLDDMLRTTQITQKILSKCKYALSQGNVNPAMSYDHMISALGICSRLLCSMDDTRELQAPFLVHLEPEVDALMYEIDKLRYGDDSE